MMKSAAILKKSRALSWMLGAGVMALLGVMPLGAAEPLVEAWRKVAAHLPSEAGAILQRANTTDPRGRELAQAVTRAVQPPTSDEKLSAAERQLLALGEGTDDVAAAALYFAGRLRELHFSSPDYAAAAQRYRTLAARQPASHWAQLGLVKLALLTLYVLPEPATPAERLTTVETLLPDVTEPALRRDLLIVLGRTRLFYGQPLPAVLADLRAADAIGGLDGLSEGNFLMQLAELSFRAREWREARVVYKRFLKLNAVDPRAFSVERRLEAIATELGETTPAKGAP
jgi:hypothetical protein